MDIFLAYLKKILGKVKILFDVTFWIVIRPTRFGKDITDEEQHIKRSLTYFTEAFAVFYVCVGWNFESHLGRFASEIIVYSMAVFLLMYGGIISWSIGLFAGRKRLYKATTSSYLYCYGFSLLLTSIFLLNEELLKEGFLYFFIILLTICYYAIVPIICIQSIAHVNKVSFIRSLAAFAVSLVFLMAICFLLLLTISVTLAAP